MNLSVQFLTQMGPEPSRLLSGLLAAFAKNNAAAWLVGGAVRDLLQGETPKDFDIAFGGDLTPLIKSWARCNKGHWFWLDKARNQSRVVFVDSVLQFDFSALRAADISADLALRDFTLNALALPLTEANPLAALIDPLDGQTALNVGLLRCCGPSVLLDDPLRVLKGVRHFARQGWKFEPATARLCVAAAPELVNVAGERIKSELGKIFGSQRVVESVELLQEYAVLDLLFPGIDQQGLLSQLTGMTARMEQLKRDDSLNFRLNQFLEEDINLQSLLLFAALWLRVSSVENPAMGLSRFRLATRCQSILKTLRGTRPIPEDTFNAVDPRIQALRLETFGANCVELLLFTLLSHENGNFDSKAVAYLAAYASFERKGQIRHLLDGQRLLTVTGLKPGPQIGFWQKRIKDAEIAGEISDENSAVSWLKEQFSD